MSSHAEYAPPSVITVGTVEASTKGHGSPDGDPPHDGTTGYFKPGISPIDADEVQLDD